MYRSYKGARIHGNGIRNTPMAPSTSTLPGYAGSEHRPPWSAYLLALAASSAFLGLRMVLGTSSAEPSLLILFLLPIIFSAYLGGLGPGLVSTITVALGAKYFLIPPLHAFAVAGMADLLQWVALLVNGSLVSILSEVLHRLRRQADAGNLLHSVVLASIGDAVIASDLQGHILFLNAEAERLTGWSAREVRGKPLTAVFRLADEHSRQPLEDVLRPGTGGTAHRALLIARNRREIAIEDSSAPIRRKDGVVIGSVLVFHDRSEKEKAQEDLRLSEGRLKLALAASHMGVWILDVRTEGTEWSPECHAIFGLDQTGAAGAAFDRFLHPEDAAGVMVKLRQAALDGIPFSAEFRIVRPDGEIRWLRSLGRTEFDAEGCSSRMVGTVQDITERKLAEVRLARESQRNRMLLRAASDGIHILDDAGHILEVSDSFCAMLGYERDELLGHPISEWDCGLAEGTDREDLMARLRGEQSTFETRYRRRGGRVLEMEISSIGVEIGSGRVIYASARDITRRKHTEFHLRLQGAALQAADNAIIITDRSGAIEWANPAFTTLTGYSLAETIGRNPRDLLKSGAQDEAFYANLWNTILEGKVWRGELVNRRKDDSRYFEHQTIAPVPDEHGIIRHFVAIKRDITELKQAETALREARETLEHAQSMAHLGSWSVDLATLSLSGSAEGSRIVGWPADASWHMPDLYALVHRRDRLRVREAWLAALQHGPYDIEHRIVVADKVKWLHVKAEVQFDEAGRPLKATGMAQDITEMREAQIALEAHREHLEDLVRERTAELEVARRDAERLARVKSEFLANMSHEIRTPLNAVLGLAQVGQRESRGRRVHDTFARILDSGNHLLGILNDILDFSKIEAGKFETEYAPFAPGEVIDQAVELVVGRAHAKGLQFRVVESADLPETCRGDRLRLAQVLVNLLSNAVKFTARGQVMLRARREGNFLVFSVEDTGIGLSREQAARLFTPFEQADGTTTRRFGGTGLGLAISKRLVEMMGGEIRVESVEGRGSVFSMRLPLHDPVAFPGRVRMDRVRLCGLEREEALAIAEALAMHGVETEEVALAAAFEAPADACVLSCRGFTVAFLAKVEMALALGRKVIIVCVPEADCFEGGVCALPEKAVVLEWPLRVRHLLLALQGNRSGKPVYSPAELPLRLEGYSILVAEDNEVNRLVLEEMLEGEGAWLVCMENGLKAVEKLLEEGRDAFHLVITDVQMPVMDGYETARRIRAIAPDLPVIGLTAHAMQEEREHCLAVGMVDRLVKPVELESLVAAIQRHARRKPGDRLAPAAETRARCPEPAPPGAGGTETPPNPEVIDWAELERRFKGKRAFADKLAAAMLSSHRDSAQRLRELALAGKSEDLVFLAHALKGASGNLRARTVQDLAARTESAARAGEAAGDVEMLRLAGELAAAMDDLLAAISERLREARAGGNAFP